MTEPVTPNAKDEDSNAQLIWQTCLDLRAAERGISRGVIQQITKLSYPIVDYHCSKFADNLDFRRMHPGAFEIVTPFHPTRVISKTLLPDGLVKLEIGDYLLELNPTERRILGNLFSGDGKELQGLQDERGIIDTVARLRFDLSRAKQQIDGLGKMLRKKTQQGDLFEKKASSSRGKKQAQPETGMVS
jgi:hypothetical protein